MRSGILREINISLSKDLTPRERRLYEEMMYWKKRAMIQRLRFINIKRSYKSKTNRIIETINGSSMNEIAQRFIQCQIENMNKNLKDEDIPLRIK
ncbi:hypothetical protein ABEB36_010616 [Hypothenemus hampei]|uniref:Uncharacterized protein n=1 Tax=Hypothenemus hampei TaxID=57062 RepID=A0ABD1ECV1_HYPHA